MKKKSIGNTMAMALAAGMLHDHVPWYRRIWRARSGSNSMKRGRYQVAYQGERECARRRRQIERGIIGKEQIYVETTR